MLKEDVERIMQAYLKTHMSEKQFEDLVTQAITDAEKCGAEKGGTRTYDQGFSDGYDACEAENGLASHQEPQGGAI